MTRAAPYIHGLYPLISDDLVPLAELIAYALRLSPFVSVLQLRFKRTSDHDANILTRATCSALSDWKGLLVINDRPDLLKMVLAADIPRPALGLHLGQDDLPPKLARDLLGPDVIIGYSTHTLEQVRNALAEPVDYLGFGPVFGTTTKENPDPVVGVERLAEAAKISHLPVVAIGGLDAPRARLCLDAGAKAAAVVSALFANLPRTEDALEARLIPFAERGLIPSGAPQL